MRLMGRVPRSRLGYDFAQLITEAGWRITAWAYSKQ
jgi:hypothetical protein